MKFVRLFIAIADLILTIPFRLIGIAAYMIYICIVCIYCRAGVECFKEFVRGLTNGLLKGVTKTIMWIKYGRNYDSVQGD